MKKIFLSLALCGLTACVSATSSGTYDGVWEGTLTELSGEDGCATNEVRAVVQESEITGTTYFQDVAMASFGGRLAEDGQFELIWKDLGGEFVSNIRATDPNTVEGPYIWRQCTGLALLKRTPPQP
jgi:hypothetical protein